MAGGPLRRLFGNAGVVLGGNAGASLLGLVSLGLTARALGPELFGILALIQTYVAFVQQFTTFSSWPVLITYGAELLEQNRRDDFKRLMKFGMLVDAAGAFLGAVAAAVAAYWVGHWRGWNAETVALTIFYSLTILSSVTGTPKAVLRLFGRFRAFALQEFIASAVKLAGVTVVFLMHGGLVSFVGVWIVTTLVGNALVILMGWRELQRRRIRGILGASLKGLRARCPGLWAGIWTTNINTSIKVVTQEIDMLVVGGLLGVREAGLYKVVKQCAKLVSQVTDPLQQVLYPELAKLWAKGERAQMRRLLLRISATGVFIASAVWLGMLAGGRPFLSFTFGASFADAYTVLLWYLGGTIVMAAGFPLAVALPATGQFGMSLRVHLLGTAVYMPSLWFLIRALGLTGAGAAYTAYHLFRTLLIGGIVRRQFSGSRNLVRTAPVSGIPEPSGF